MVYNIGQMELIMKVTGTITKLKVKEHFGTPKEMSTEASSEMIWLMDMVSTHISTEVNIKENFLMMYKKVMEKKNGSTVQNM